MKNVIVFIFTALMAVSCGNGGASDDKKIQEVIESKDLLKIKNKRAEVQAVYEKYANELKALDEAIAQLDTVRKVPLVTVVSVKDTLFKHHIEIQGSVDTKENILVYPQFSGAVVSLNVKAGQKVSKGQVLATIEDGGLRSQLAQLETQASLAKTTYERQSRLWNQKIGSEIQYLQAKTNMESTQKMVAQLRAQVEKTLVKAPFSGYADQVMIEAGQVVSPGVPLIRVVNLSDMYVSASVPEGYLSRLKVGTTVEVFVKTIGKNYVGKVRQIGNYINPNNRSFDIEISIPNSDNLLRPNQVAVLKIEDYVNTKAIVVPENIVQENANGEKIIFKVETPDAKGFTKVVKQVVELGQTTNSLVEVKSGLTANTLIIKEGVKGLSDGSKVQVIK